MKSNNLRNWILAADLVWVAIAMTLAYVLRYGWVWEGPPGGTAKIFTIPLLGSILIWSVLSSRLKLDGFQSGWRLSAIVSQLLPAVSVVMAGLFVAGYLIRHYISRLALGYFGALLFLGLVLIRLLARLLFRSRYSVGKVRRVVIVGSGPLAKEMTTKIESHPETLYEVIGFLSTAETSSDMPTIAGNSSAITVQTLGIVDVLRAHQVDELILAIVQPSRPEIVELTARCRREGIAVSLVPQSYELYLSKPELIDLGGLPLLQLKAAREVNPIPYWKRLTDLVLTSCLLPLSLPPMLLAAAVLRHKKKNAFYRELRCGLHGKPFYIYRLNSPRNASNLPRSERILQQLSLTELPQLLNVLRGEMSLVGPRPEGLDRANHYTDWHRQRLSVKPGMTGLAQVHGLRDQNSSEDKTRYDLQYILHRSLFQDISLLLQTLWTLMGRLLQVKVLPVPSCSERAAGLFVNPGIEESLNRAHSSQPSSN
jgi:lipopolysaccharide/colanic/teichoic acid biosynthesis glycosyltransferase